MSAVLARPLGLGSTLKSNSVNATWMPNAMVVANPSIQWEFPLVHLVNFMIYLGTFVCFEFFWHQLGRYQRISVWGESFIILPEWTWLALGYSLFLWSSLSLIQVWAVTPDMLMAAFVYLAAGLVLRIRIGSASWGTFVGLGVVLGLGYLAKAVMFPLAFIFLGVAFFSARNRQ